MARSWTEVKADAHRQGLTDPERVAEHAGRLMAEVRAHRLADVRKAQHVPQTDLARLMGVTQGRVSKIERGEIDRTELATIRAYVEALGGRLRVVAEFGDEHLTVA